jgi:PAT family beta-lactamase induction signal transducer AmpG
VRLAAARLRRTAQTLGATLRDAIAGLAKDLWSLLRSPGGIAAVVICLSPVGSGAAANLFGAIADDWRAPAGLVVAVTTTVGSLVSAAGAAWGGWIAARIGRRSAYALCGAVTAATGVAMAIAPRAPWTYALFTLAYQTFNGAAFAAFSAFAFEIAGHDSVATKYNILASLANTSIAYTTRADGAAHARWGARGVLLADAALTAAGIALLGATIAITRPKGTRRGLARPETDARPPNEQ